MFSLIRRRLFCLLTEKNSPVFLSIVRSNIELLPGCIDVINMRSKHIYKPAALREGPQPSRYHPEQPIEAAESQIQSILKEKVSMNDEDWGHLKTKLTTSVSFITEENVCSIIMNCILMLNKLDFAHSFIKYLEQGSVKPNFLTYLKYIALCGRNHRLVDEELILKTFEKIQAHINNPVLDLKSIECIIQGLCATHKWRDSFHYLKKSPQNPNLEIHSSLACAAIRNNDENLAWDILTNWIKDGEVPTDRVVEEFLLVILELQQKKQIEGDLLIQKLFQYIHVKNIIINYKATKLIEQYFVCHSAKWTISYTKVNRGGICENCNYSLKPSELTNEEFSYLKQAFLEQVVMKSDVFINSTPKEFNRYVEFIEKNKPFHIVLDGLNVAYTFPYRKSNQNLAFHLLKVVRFLRKKSTKLLVLGKSHMRKWPLYAMQKLEEKAHVFYTHNISQDDPFTLYAALASGPHTLFLSADLMRDHMSRLANPKAVRLFKKWQQSHQIFLVNEDKEVKFIKPVKHSIILQGNMNYGWHIPFDDKIILDPYEELNNWLCIRKDL